MDPADLEKKITSRTKAIIPVHMRGMPAKIDRIMEIARRHSLKVIEDVPRQTEAPSAVSRLAPSVTSGASPPVPQDHHLGRGGSSRDERGPAVHARPGLPRRGRLLAQGPLRAARVLRRDLLRRELPHERAHGAVALAQFRKLDSIVSRMRRNKKLIKDRLRDLKGLEFREVTDEAGDTAICLVWYLPAPPRSRST